MTQRKPTVKSKSPSQKNKSLAKKKFAQEYVITDNATEAVRRAFPELAKTAAPGSLEVKASRLLRNDHVRAEIALQQNKLEILAGKAINKVEELIDSDDEKVATQNAWNTIRQTHGAPTASVNKTEVKYNIDTVLGE